MVFQDIFLSQYFLKYLGVLFDDTRIRDHINNPFKTMFRRVAQGKPKGGHGLASAGRYRELVQSLPPASCLQTSLQYSRPSSIYRCQIIIGKPGFHMAFQTPEKDIHTIIVSPSRILSQHELFRIQIISVHKA